MDKVFKIKKNDLINNFKIACDKLDYKDIEVNPVTDSITYKALGKGLQWGTNAVVKVVFTEKEGFTNASFGIIKEIRFPKFGKQKLAEKFYKEIIGLVEVLNESTIKTNQSFNDITTETNAINKSNKNEIKTVENKKNNSSNSKSNSENIENYLDKNKKEKNNKLLIFGGIFILVLIITQLSNSSSSSSSSINACECSERWLSTPKSMMKSTDKWKYDECVRKYGGFAGANNACIKSK